MSSKTTLLNAAATTTVTASKAIINAYVRRIKRGVITIDDVPEVIREEVRKALEESE